MCETQAIFAAACVVNLRENNVMDILPRFIYRVNDILPISTYRLLIKAECRKIDGRQPSVSRMAN